MSIISSKIVGENVDYETYARQAPGVGRGHPEFSMSRSEACDFVGCPEKWLAGCQSQDTKATIWGRLAECLEMAPSRFSSLFATTPENYPCEPSKRDPRTEKPWTTRSDYCKDWEAEMEKAGLTVISPKEMSEASIAVKAAQAYAPRAELVACSKKQVMCVGEFQDKETGIVIPVRCLIDLVPDQSHPVFGQMLGDSKTARNENPNTFDRVIDDQWYDCQAALSTDLYAAATGEDRNTWILPLQGNVHPYHIVKPMPALSVEFLAWGREKYQQALKFYAQCLASGTWPSYSTGNRLVVEPCQFVSPDAIWKYRESGGAVARNIVECQRLPAPVNSGDVTP